MKTTKPTKAEMLLRNLANLVGAHVLSALDAKEIKDSYAELSRAHTKAERYLKKRHL